MRFIETFAQQWNRCRRRELSRHLGLMHAFKHALWAARNR